MGDKRSEKGKKERSTYKPFRVIKPAVKGKGGKTCSK